MQERFEFRTSLLLDRATFGRRELSRLELDARIHWMASANQLMSAYKLDSTREGTMVLIIVEGSAEQMLRFFDTLLNQNIVSLVYVRTGIISQTSDEYKRHWSDIYSSIKKDIETQALTKWATNQDGMTTKDMCAELMEIQRIHAPQKKGRMTLNSPGLFLPEVGYSRPLSSYEKPGRGPYLGTGAGPDE